MLLSLTIWYLFTPMSSFTVSQLIQSFKEWLPLAGIERPGNYPRIARHFADYCISNQLAIDSTSLDLYAIGKSPNRISPVKKLLWFYKMKGSPTVVADPPLVDKKPSSPIAGIIENYLNGSANALVQQTQDNYRKTLHEFFIYLEEQLLMPNPMLFSVKQLNRYRKNMKKRQLSMATINFHLSVIKQLTGWLLNNASEFQLDNQQRKSFGAVMEIKGEKKERRFVMESLAEEERDALLNHIQEPMDRAIATLLAIEGLRTVEVTRLQISDLDFDQQQLWITGKTSDHRTPIAMLPICLESLQAYLQSVGEWPVLPNHNAPLFPDLKTHHIRYLVDKYLKELSLKRSRISAHSLRHSAGQLMLQQGQSPKFVQRHLRHKTFEITQFYLNQEKEEADLNTLAETTFPVKAN